MTERHFPVVGIGASAGGLTAISAVLAALPPEPGVAIVVIQHLDRRYPSQLIPLLQTHTQMAVVAAVHGVTVERDHVYVIAPNTEVAIVDGVLSVTSRPDVSLPDYPIDHFFRSLAAVESAHAVAVILSGTGSDGTLGVWEVKAAGGLTLAQDDHSAEHTGMPRSAVASGAIDLVLSPEMIAARLVEFARHPFLDAREASEIPAADEDSQFRRVIAALRHATGVDFSQYRDTTIKRRTARRMLLRGFRSPDHYVKLLEEDRAEAEALYRDVLINVTSFFRDPGMFEDLKRDIFPGILSRKAESALPIRVWVPGCSTGQEAYSVAMALVEYLDTVRADRAIQIFATDLGDPGSLDKARAGVYPESIEGEVSPERLRRFFVKENQHYRVQKFLRDLCVFSRQNLTVDPPFSRVDLVTCRNVLIYMSPVLQERLMPIFHFALNPDGFLVLGQAETVGTFGDLFELVNRTHKVYRRKETARRPALTFMADDWLAGLSSKRAPARGTPLADVQREADRIVLDRYAPPSVLVNGDFDIQQFRGRTSPFLETPSGNPTTNLLRLAREGLFTELRSALNEAKATKAPVVREGLRVLDRGTEIEFTLRILPVGIAHMPDGCLLVLFETRNWPIWSLPPAPQAAREITGTDRDVAWLQQELAASRQYLQSVLEQQDAAAQELRAAHEEVLSSNEELQSTNEELETAKEELQSANEELTTVNEQERIRNRELAQLTDELSNFISSTDLPLVTVDRELRIRRLTPAASPVFNLLPADVGRSIEHIKSSLVIEGLRPVIEGVIDQVRPWQREVTDHQNRWWLLRVLPYRTADHRIDGATIVAVDIDIVRQTHQVLEERDYALAVIQTVREPLVVLDERCHVGLANSAFYEMFGETADRMEDKALWHSSGVWSEAELRRVLAAACSGDGELRDRQVERFVPGQGLRHLILNTRRIVRPDRSPLTLLSIEDVTDARQAETLRVDAETLRRVDRRKDEFLGILAHELRNPLAPMRFALELLSQSAHDPQAIARVHQVLDRQVDHMVRIVDDLLDVSRITQGKVELRKERVTLDRIVDGAVELCNPVVGAAHHALTVSIPNERIVIEADPVRMTQVLVNLLNNAAKFTPPHGHIWLLAETIGTVPHDPDQIQIRVRDTGIGIAPETCPTIFDMFVQGDLSLERTRGGLGVGLTLVRSLVLLHGGTVDVRSDGPGTGSEFTIRLPLDPSLQQPDGGDGRAVIPGATRSLRILVADDYDDGREMLTLLLTTEGHTVVSAADGLTALAAIESFRPDVALLDLGMPGLSGFGVAEAVRKQSHLAAVTLVALSGLGQKEDKERAHAAGFDIHFTKPLDIDMLRAFLASA